MPRLELNPEKIYKIPNSIFIKNIDSYYLVIATELANWLLLQNEKQLEIFELLLSGKSIAEVLRNIPADMQGDLLHVLVELEAKKFECQEVNYPQEQGMYIYLTNRCNQRCRHCYMYAGEQQEQELTTKEVLKVVRGFAESGGKVITFTGGEATLRPDFKEIVTFAKKNELIVGVLSNGIAWPQEWMAWVKNTIDEVQISIDGYDAETYRYVRGKDTFNAALDTVDRLINVGIRVTVAITPLMETLISKENEYIKFAKQLIDRYEGKKFFVKFNTELMDGRTINPTKTENDKYRKSINQIKNACALCSEEKGFALDHKRNTIFNNCGYGGLSIASNGDIYFCNLIDKCACQGNIRNMKFDEIIAISQKARKFSDVSNLLPCKNCDLKYLCGGGCRVKNFKTLSKTIISKEEKGDFFVREPICTEKYKEQIYRLMIRANNLFYQ